MNTEPRKGFNWGAFMFTWIWGIGNSAYLTLLCFVPLLNLIWPFICGFKGNEWALNSGAFQTVEEFNAAQKTWNRAGIAMFILMAVFILIYVVFGVIMFTTLNSIISY